MEVSLFLLYGNGRCFIQRSDPLFHRRPANADLFHAPPWNGYRRRRLHHRYENPGLSNRFGVLFFGYGCVEASLLSKTTISNFSFVTIIGLLCNSAFIIPCSAFLHSASGLRISCSAKGYGFFISCIYASIRRSGMRKLAESFKYFMAAPACWENRSSCIWGLAFLQSFRSRAPA